MLVAGLAEYSLERPVQVIMTRGSTLKVVAAVNYGCRPALEMDGPEKATHPVNTRALSAADLNTSLLQIIPNSLATEQMVDDILGLALFAFDSAEISEAKFRDLSAK